jgi:hypothetical protein
MTCQAKRRFESTPNRSVSGKDADGAERRVHAAITTCTGHRGVDDAHPAFVAHPDSDQACASAGADDSLLRVHYHRKPVDARGHGGTHDEREGAGKSRKPRIEDEIVGV